MEYCKEGLKLIQEASHENIMEYNVSYTMILNNYFIETFGRFNNHKN